MIPLSIIRVLTVLFGISSFLAFGDQLLLEVGMPTRTAAVVSGFMGGALVFGMAYQGGQVLTFCIKRLISDPAREARIRSAMAKIGPSADGRYPAMAGQNIQVALIDTKAKVAFTVRCGDGHKVFLSTNIVDVLSDNALCGVLSHECGHVASHHPIRQAMVLGLVAGIKMGIGIPAGAAVVLLLAYLYMLREWEYAADAGGVALAGKEPLLSAMDEYLALDAGKDMNRFSEFFSGHPSFNRRVAAVRYSSET